MQDKQNFIIDFLNNVKKLSDKKKLSRNECKNIFGEILNLLDVPHPPSEIEEYFWNNNIICDFLLKMINKDSIEQKIRLRAHKIFGKIIDNISGKRAAYQYTVRALSSGGFYPNIEIKRNFSKFFIQNQQPILITKDRVKKDHFLHYSIINWLSKNELRFIVAIMCAPQEHWFNFSFDNYDSIKIDSDLIDYIPSKLQNLFIKEYFEINRRIGYYKPINRSDYRAFKYKNYSENLKYFNLIYDNFKTSNHLLLRTCNYFVKARLHWNNSEIYAEEGIVNIFFCLEGCLHLLQKKYHNFNPKLDFQLLNNIFREEKSLGENLLEYIKEAYDKRTTLVHAEPEWGADWSPFLTYEDFWDYFTICRQLLNFILIDRHL